MLASNVCKTTSMLHTLNFLLRALVSKGVGPWPQSSSQGVFSGVLFFF